MLFKLPNASKRPSIENLQLAFLSAISSQAINKKKCAVLFSGGLDSSLIAYAVSKKVKRTELYCVGLPNAKVFEKASKAASLLNLSLNTVIIDEERLHLLLPKIAKIISSENKMQLQIAVPFYFCMERIKEHNIKHVFSGQGADELFFGYDEFRRMLQSKSNDGLETARLDKLQKVCNLDIKRDLAIAKNFSLSLHFPFLESSFVFIALAFPPKENICGPNDFLRKHVLRKLAKKLGLPDEICYERKNAIQYGSGVSKRIKQLFNTKCLHL
ncbi:MAG: asparagine synthase-related protein [Candidatus Diapherotrites archaeon]|nr:asparagine synthase-related protein [Candidatus Diapherotrites archaeon]